MSHNPKQFYRFGPFIPNVSDRIVVHSQQELRLTSTGLDLLIFFVTRPGELVSRDDLKHAVWKTANLSDNNVDQRIAEIREALGRCDGSAREYIQNIRGHGWRFVPPVRLPAADAVAMAQPPIVRAFPTNFLKPVLWAATVVAIAVILVAGRLGKPRPEPAIAGWRQLTNDGLPKSGPVVTDGRFIYFAESRDNIMGSPLSPAAVPVSGGEVDMQNSPGGPSLLLWDRAQNTGDTLYARRDPQRIRGNTIYWKTGLALSPMIDDAECARISPDGRSIAYSTRDREHELLIRDIGPSPNLRKIQVPGHLDDPAWSPDGAGFGSDHCLPSQPPRCDLGSPQGREQPTLAPVPFDPRVGVSGRWLDTEWCVFHLLGNQDVREPGEFVDSQGQFGGITGPTGAPDERPRVLRRTCGHFV